MKERERTTTERIARIDWLKDKRQATIDARKSAVRRGEALAKKPIKSFTIPANNKRAS